MTHSIPVVGVERVSQHDFLIMKARVLMDQDLKLGYGDLEIRATIKNKIEKSFCEAGAMNHKIFFSLQNCRISIFFL